MKNLTNEDLAELTQNIATFWEFVPGPRIIRRKREWPKLLLQWTLWRKYTFPVQVLYRHSKECWLKDLNLRGAAPFPFASMPVAGVFSLDKDWKIPISDRRYLKHGPLYAADGRTIIVKANEKWWDNGLVQLFLIIAGLASIIGLFWNAV